MAERIANLQQSGVAIAPFPPEQEGKITNATIKSPDGQGFFMFEGEI